MLPITFESNYTDFILNYDVVDNQIIIHYANGDSKVLDYSTEEEKNIILKMKRQIIQSEDYKSILKSDIIHDRVFGICNTIIAIELAVSPSKIWSIPVFLNTLRYLIKLSSNKRAFNDLEKNELFLENEELLQEYGFNINNIDDINYDTLKEVLDNIENEDSLKLSLKNTD